MLLSTNDRSYNFSSMSNLLSIVFALIIAFILLRNNNKVLVVET